MVMMPTASSRSVRGDITQLKVRSYISTLKVRGPSAE